MVVREGPAHTPEITLVAWDGSEDAARALAWAADHARGRSGWIVVVQVAAGDDRPEELRDRIRSHAHAFGIEPRIDVVVGADPVRALIEAADRHRATQLCLGTRGDARSVAHRVARRSLVPVTLVPTAGRARGARRR